MSPNLSLTLFSWQAFDISILEKITQKKTFGKNRISTWGVGDWGLSRKEYGIILSIGGLMVEWCKTFKQKYLII